MKPWLNSLSYVWLMFRGCLIQDYLNFLSLIHSNTFLCSFLLVFSLATLAFMGPFMFPTFISSMQVDGFLVEKFLVEMRPVAFPLVNFECDAYLAVNHSLFYSYPKMFLPFFSLIVTAWVWFTTIFLGSYLGFFLFVTPGSG